MKRWRDLTRARLLVRRDESIADAPPPESFRADVLRYLPAVKALPSFTERVRDMGVWLRAFDELPTLEITSLMIQTLRDQWLTVGPRLVQQKGKPKAERWKVVHKPLSASAVNHRLRALSNLFTVLYPKSDNPVHDVEEADEGEAVPRSVPYVVIRRVLDAMADRGAARVKGQLRETISEAKIRARCLAWTGMTPTELMRLTPTDNRWKESLVILGARRKGKGAPGRLVPLQSDGKAALKDLDTRQLYGPFNVGVVNLALARACVVANVPRITCYTLRHSFITGVVAATNNLQLGGLLAGHRDDRTTRRYRLAAEMGVMQDGMAKFGKANRKGRKSKAKLPRKSPSRRTGEK